RDGAVVLHQDVCHFVSECNTGKGVGAEQEERESASGQPLTDDPEISRTESTGTRRHIGQGGEYSDGNSWFNLIALVPLAIPGSWGQPYQSRRVTKGAGLPGHVWEESRETRDTDGRNPAPSWRP